MANCPKCEKPIPLYQSFRVTRWSGAKCKYCGTESFYNQKSIALWGVILGLTCSLTYIAVYFVSQNFIVQFSSCTIVGYLVWLTIGWNKIKLEVRKK